MNSSNTRIVEKTINRCNFNLSAIFIAALIIFFSIGAFAADITVHVQDSQGNPHPGYFSLQKGPNFIGSYPSGTTVNINAGDSIKLWATDSATISSTDRMTFLVDTGGHTFSFKTTNVTLHFSGGYLNYRTSGSWSAFSRPSMEMFPNDYYGNTMRFQFGDVWNDPKFIDTPIDYEGQVSIEKTIAVMQLLDHNGSPIAGGTARGGHAAPTTWFVPGMTNANGLLLDMRDGEQNNLSYEMKINGTTDVEGPKDPTLDSYYLFQTGLVTLRLETCNGTPLDGGLARFGNGAVYTTQFFPNNPGTTTGSSAPGEVESEMFGGTYSFEMQYQGTSDRKISVVIPETGATLVWQTTEVTLNYNGIISYGGPTGDSRFFNQPTMNLLAGTYKFHFRNGGRTDVTFAGCSYEKGAALVKVIDCDGNYKDSVAVEWYQWGFANGPHNMEGLTGTEPMVLLIDPAIAHVSVIVNYLGRENLQHQVIANNSEFIFNMTETEVQLWNHDSTATLTPQNAQFYVHGNANNKMSLMPTLKKCLLPGLYGFVLHYNHTNQTRTLVNIDSVKPVVFQTGLVDDVDECTFNPTTYAQWGNGLNPQPFSDPMEFLPCRMLIQSSTEPTEDFQVQAGAIYRLMGCDPEVIMDSCVSDSSWMKSTVQTPTDWSGTWTGVASLPDTSTFTLPAEVGQPYSWGGMTEVEGSRAIKTGYQVTYFRKNFGLTDSADVEAHFRMYMDDGTEVYINGHLLFREENMDADNFKGVPHDILFEADGDIVNGYLGGDSFDHVPAVNLDNVLRSDYNTIIVVMRNNKNVNNVGGFSFRMDITKNGESVLVKKKGEVDMESAEESLLVYAYPNPTDGLITVQINNSTPQVTENEMMLYDINGKLLQHTKVSVNEGGSRYMMDISEFPKGFYILRVNSGDAFKSIKLKKY